VREREREKRMKLGVCGHVSINTSTNQTILKIITTFFNDI
jgi:hypothetical protein